KHPAIERKTVPPLWLAEAGHPGAALALLRPVVPANDSDGWPGRGRASCQRRRERCRCADDGQRQSPPEHGHGDLLRVARYVRTRRYRSTTSFSDVPPDAQPVGRAQRDVTPANGTREAPPVRRIVPASPPRG